VKFVVELFGNAELDMIRYFNKEQAVAGEIVAVL